jgi:putative transposase
MKRETLFISIRKNIQSDGFYDEACFKYYLLRLLQCSPSFEISLHSYALFENEILLLCTPMSLIEQNLFLKFLNKSYSEYFNSRFERSAKVWNSNHSMCCVDESNVMTYQKYIENSPVSRGLTDHPGTYEWSSYCSNCFNRRPPFLTPHSRFREIYVSHINPHEAYRGFIARPFKKADIAVLKEQNSISGL